MAANPSYVDDVRFSKILQDPRFRTIPKKKSKVKIDKRFKSMFTEERFTLKYPMDKRGHQQKHLLTEYYNKFYQIDEDGKDDDERNEKEINEKQSTENLDNSSRKREGPKLSHNYGYHRGFNIKLDTEGDEAENKDFRNYNESSSSSSSSSSESESEDEELDHNWGELDKDAPTIDQSTNRIAICNLDWDRMNAQDLYVLLNSFKPLSGSIQSVKIYYSKFGEERLKIEKEKGPSEFIFGKSSAISIVGDENDGDSEGGQEELGNLSEPDEENEEERSDKKTVEKLRKYQLERLKYFYAVVECDCIETAEIISKELDGMEYETSSTLLDIRFVPNEMNFDDVRLKEECDSMPPVNYKAPSFTTTALQQCNVKFTWDETDPKRKEIFNRAFEDQNENDIDAYLASSSSNDEDDGEDDVWKNKEIFAQDKDSDKIEKYKNLLSFLNTKEKEKSDFDLEVTWKPEIKFGDKNRDNSDSDDSEDDSENDSGESDPTKIANESEEKINEANQTNPEELNLLLMDVEERSNKKHFNYDKIVENFNRSSRSKSKNLNDNDDDDDIDADDDDDGFVFDAEDERFNSIYNSHHFNIDQSDPNFKRTEAFDKILERKRARARNLINNEQEDNRDLKNSHLGQKEGKKSLRQLINRIKSKTPNNPRTLVSIDGKDVKKKFNTNARFKH
ncbi:ESF1 -like protein [Sarcoptes scabiei]|uniref:ESF1 -like protein n=1 Tax=Sarcoptes scabiei TaxID=52283 RepID=A0A834R3I4_SARSC|nr:ESF1 -like protein [Sarcoptes scabiei]